MCDSSGAGAKFVSGFQQQRGDEFGQAQGVGPQDTFGAELGPSAQPFNAAEVETAEQDFMEGWGGSHMANMEAMERSMGLMGGLGATGMEAAGGMGQVAGLEHAEDFEAAFAEQMKVPLRAPTMRPPVHRHDTTASVPLPAACVHAKPPESFPSLQLMQQQHPELAGAGAFPSMPKFEEASTDAWLQRYSDRLRFEGDDELANMLEDSLHKEAPVYVFQGQNPHLFTGPEGEQALGDRGVESLQRGDHYEAVLLLEAEVTRSPQNATAWEQLGIGQAEMDNDTQAIAALVKAVELDATNLSALLELGVSCTNELDQTQALIFMQTWLEAHPVHGATRDPELAPVAPESLQFLQHVTGEFRRAAEQHEDSDVYLALGVLANLREDYSEATQCFKQGLRLTPQSHSLWNKLGATAANGGRSKEAVYAYNQALHLKPTYVRSWANAGIAHANLGDHTNAVSYYLRALFLNPEVDHVWDNLRRTCEMMGRADLLEKIQEKDIEPFRSEFPHAFP